MISMVMPPLPQGAEILLREDSGTNLDLSLTLIQPVAMEAILLETLILVTPLIFLSNFLGVEILLVGPNASKYPATR